MKIGNGRVTSVNRLKHLSESCQVRLEKVTDEHKLLQEEIKRLWPLEEDNRTLGEVSFVLITWPCHSQDHVTKLPVFITGLGHTH